MTSQYPQAPGKGTSQWGTHRDSTWEDLSTLKHTELEETVGDQTRIPLSTPALYVGLVRDPLYL